jgi:hypothetical protein
MKPVDIMQECTQLFSQEDTLAYFDFTFSGSPRIEGLCRIAHPKKNAGGTEYVSLVFILDTPDEADREYATEALKQLGSGVLETMLPEIASSISVPPRGTTRQIYIKQFDLMLKDLFKASQEFISNRLYPALKTALGVNAGELSWWDSGQKENTPAPGAAWPKKPKSFIARLQEKLFSR